jgi:hypothetical protein
VEVDVPRSLFDYLKIVSWFLRTVGTLAFEYVMIFFLSIMAVQKCVRGFRPFHDLVLAKLSGE